jgi:MFS family permease
MQHPRRDDPVKDSHDAVRHHYRNVVWVVAIFSVLFGLEAGVESGVGPCTVTTLSETLHSSVTAVATAQTMAEVTKMAGSFVVAVFTTSASVQAALVSSGAFVWAVGAYIVGVAPSVTAVGVGFFFMGLGYSMLAVLVAPILEHYVVTQRHRHKVALCLGIVYAGSALGVAAEYVVCGATVSLSWRWNYLGPAVVVLPLASGLIVIDRRAARTRAALPPAELVDNDDEGTDAQMVPSIMTDPAAVAGAYAGAADDMKETASVAAHGLGTDSVVAALALLKPDIMPPWRLVLHTRLLMTNTCFVWSVVNQTAFMFFLTAFIILLPVYVEVGLQQSKTVVSIIMAATVPASAVGSVLGGVIVGKWRLGLDGQLRIVAITAGMAIPVAFGFLMPLVPFVITLVAGLMILFVNGSPARTLLPLLIDQAGLVRQLRDEVDLRSGSAALDAASAAKADTVAREVLIAHSNALSNLILRLFGTVPGPIVLAALIDGGMPMRWAFWLVGLSGMVVAMVSGYLAWRARPKARP